MHQAASLDLIKHSPALPKSLLTSISWGYELLKDGLRYLGKGRDPNSSLINGRVIKLICMAYNNGLPSITSRPQAPSMHQPAQETEQTADQPKHAGGRPLLFETVEQLDAAIEQYLGDCAPHKSKHAVVIQKADGTEYWAMSDYLTDQKPVTVSGAAFALGTNRRTLLDYKERSEYLPSIERLLAACEAYAESMLFTNAANGAKFNLINNYRGKYEPWADKQVVAGDPEAPLGNPMAGLTAEQLRRLADESEQDHPDGDHSADQT